MKDTPAIYQGKIVSKKNFRAFIYAPHGGQKLVNSWDEYEHHMETGLWFPTKEDAAAALMAVAPQEPDPIPVPQETDEVIEKPKNTKSRKGSDDGFLPKTR